MSLNIWTNLTEKTKTYILTLNGFIDTKLFLLGKQLKVKTCFKNSAMQKWI